MKMPEKSYKGCCEGLNVRMRMRRGEEVPKSALESVP